MDVGLSEAHTLLRDNVSAWADRELAPIAAEIDRLDEFPPGLWKAMGGLGILGVNVPTEYGGSGFDLLAGVLVIEQIARRSGSVALSYGAHANLCMGNIVRNGSPEQLRQYLPPLCEGSAVGALALTEPEAGSDAVGGMAMRAVRDGDEYVLAGTKTFITNGPVADTLVVYAKTDPELRQHGISAFIVESAMEGFSVARTFDKFGHRGSPTGELVFDGVRVPAGNLLRRENEGVAVLMSGLDSERVFLAGESLGLAEAALEIAVDYARQRHQFGQPIGSFQLIQGKLADMYTQVEAARALVYRTAVAAEQAEQEGARFGRNAAAAIMFASEVSTRVALDAMQIQGGYGYLTDSPIPRIVRDAKLLEIGAGTTEIRKTIIARDLLQPGG